MVKRLFEPVLLSSDWDGPWHQSGPNRRPCLTGHGPRPQTECHRRGAHRRHAQLEATCGVSKDGSMGLWYLMVQLIACWNLFDVFLP